MSPPPTTAPGPHASPLGLTFAEVARRRPLAIIAPGSLLVDEPPAPGATRGEHHTPHPAPYAAAVLDLDDLAGDEADRVGVLEVALLGPDGVRLAARLDLGERRAELVTRVPGDGDGGARTHRSRRHGRLPPAPVTPTALAITLTGSRVVALVRERDASAEVRWVARARYDLREVLDVHDPAWTADLRTGWSWDGDPPPPVARVRAGGFGQLGLRDVRVVTNADGTPFRPAGRGGHEVLLTATSAGPGFFDTAHTSVWRLDPATLRLTHLSDLFFERPDRAGVFGDHATHLLRDGDRWLVATSTWGDFDPARRGATVAVTLAETGADLLAGRHVLTTRALPLPVDGLRSVGVWDPHLVRPDAAEGGGWLVGYVSARRFFDFHPVVAAGPGLDALTLRGAADRSATEGTTLLRLDGAWRALASDGRDNRRAVRERYPVFATEPEAAAPRTLPEVGVLDAPYLTNIPWPTLVPEPDGGWLMIAFDGAPVGGELLGYGTHGRVVLLRGGAGGEA